jgi:hypothetical protein
MTGVRISATNPPASLRAALEAILHDCIPEEAAGLPAASINHFHAVDLTAVEKFCPAIANGHANSRYGHSSIESLDVVSSRTDAFILT